MATQDQVRRAPILIIDDNEAEVRLLRRVLLRHGYENVRGTTDPARGVELFRSLAPDLVILDLCMPRMNGFEVLSALRAEPDAEETLPVMVVSAEDDQGVRVAALDGGAVDFVLKPYDCRELLTRVRHLLQSRLRQREADARSNTLVRELAERSRALEAAQLETLDRLARAAEYRDDDTGTHIERMSESCGLLARAVGVEPQLAEEIRVAARLHDVGKIATPDRVLLKPGKLDAEEWAIMQSHTVTGAQLLAGLSSPAGVLAAQIARSHHERWDGGGYPDGLAGEAIPFGARVAAVADVFDALTSERPYKLAWPVDRALEVLREGRGTAFEARLVDAFERILPEVLELRRRFAARGEMRRMPGEVPSFSGLQGSSGSIVSEAHP